MHVSYISEYLQEAYSEMSSYNDDKLREFMVTKSAEKCAIKQPLPENSYLDGKFDNSTISEEGNPVILDLCPKTFIAKILSRLSKKMNDQSKRYKSYSIKVNDQIIGDLDINIDDEYTVNIVWIGINNKYRGNGYAQMTLRLIIDQIINEGFKYITLEVPGNSPDAHHIYQKIGFKDIESISDEEDVWGGLTSMKLDVKDYNRPEIKSLAESVLMEAGDKEGVYKENYYFRDHLQIPYISGVLAKRKNRDLLVSFVSKFLDDHHSQLVTAGPVYSFTFGDTETSFLYNMFNITAEQILVIYEEMIKETYYGKISSFFTGWVKNAPHKILITAILVEALQKGYDDIRECCEYLYAFTEYPIVYRIFWKTNVREDVMDYTIEHLGSKFKVKKVGNLQGLLKYDANSSVNNMYEPLMDGVDNAYMDLMQRMRNQIKNTFVNIARAYYDNIEKNATQHSNVSTFDDGTLADQEGHITNIAQFVDKTVGKFASGDVNASIARITADRNQVDKNNLINFLNQIISAKKNNLSKFVENIITIYFNKNPTDTSLGSTEFLNFGIAMYRSIGTSKDPMYQEVKSILNMWMNDIINIRQFYNREATIISYTRAIFDYVILMINHYN